MVGIPESCQTKKDWQNAVKYAASNNEGKMIMFRRLEHLRDDHFMKVLKKGSESKKPEELTDDDYELVDNPSAPRHRLGFTDGEITAMMEVLA